MKLTTYNVADMANLMADPGCRAGAEIDLELTTEGNPEFLISMGGFYTVAELEWMVQELKNANRSFPVVQAFQQAGNEIWEAIKDGTLH